MGLLDRVKALRATPEVVEALAERRTNFNIALGGTNQAVAYAWQQAQAASYGYLYLQQPAVRRVVDYIARNVSQLGLKLYERVDENERQERGDHPAAVTMRAPNPATPDQQFIFNAVAEWLVYDNSYTIKLRPERRGPLYLLCVPSPRVAVLGSTGYDITAYRVYRSDGSFFDVDPGDVIHWRGYNPEDSRIGVSKLETLRQELMTDAAIQTASSELMKSGLGTAGIIQRPLEAPQWADEDMKRFQESFAKQMKDQGRHFPVLEEGMTFEKAFVSPKDAEMLDARRFTREEVASLYGVGTIPPKTEDERQQFYADVLPPVCELFCAHFGKSILQDEYLADDLYWEFALDEKLTGNERLKALVSASGAPILSRNESRAKLNLPPKDGGDDLIVPLNVTEGGKPSPAVMPPQNLIGPSQDGDYREEEEPKAIVPTVKALEVTNEPKRDADMRRQRRYIDEGVAMLERFYSRQLRTIKSKAAFDAERWNRELADDIHRFLGGVVEREAGIYAARLGGLDFDGKQVANYLRAWAENAAKQMNAVTQRNFDSDDFTAREALERGKGERAIVAGTGLGTRATVFSRREAAKQSPTPEQRRQVWIANSERHANLDGAVVGLDSDWGGIEPGSEPNCSCGVLIE